MTLRATTLLTLLAPGTAGHDLDLLPERFHVATGETLTIALHNGDASPESEANAPLEKRLWVPRPSPEPEVCCWLCDRFRTLSP
jgi:hypothetical protein